MVGMKKTGHGQYINYIGDDESWNVMKSYVDRYIYDHFLYMYAFIFTLVNWTEGHIFEKQETWKIRDVRKKLKKKHGVFTGNQWVFDGFWWFLMVFDGFCHGFHPFQRCPGASCPSPQPRTARWWRRRSSAPCCRCSRSPAATRPSASWTAKRRLVEKVDVKIGEVRGGNYEDFLRKKYIYIYIYMYMYLYMYMYMYIYIYTQTLEGPTCTDSCKFFLCSNAFFSVSNSDLF